MQLMLRASTVRAVVFMFVVLAQPTPTAAKGLTEQQLAPIWSTLPKNKAGNIERRSLRYLVHRHFTRRSALQIRGFEPSRPSSSAGWGDADILAQRVPAFVESFLESSHKLERGFALGDAAKLVTTIERLIFDSESSVLEKAYARHGEGVAASLDRQTVELVLENYIHGPLDAQLR